MYGESGQLNFINITVAQNTDTIILRGTIPNPLLPSSEAGKFRIRELFDNEFVTVFLEGVEPVMALAIPRSAVLTDQQGDYVFVVGPDNKAQQQRIQLGQSTPSTAIVMSGLTEGQMVIVDGLQRVRTGQTVAPGPPAVQPQMPPASQ
jgi:membrane fusion protein (multidrug efflux system)